MGIEVASMVEIVPGFVVLGRANPHIEICMDPRTRSQRIERAEISMALDSFGHSYSFHRGIILQRIIKSPQKFAAGFRIVFPGVLAIENDCNHGILPRGEDWLR